MPSAALADSFDAWQKRTTDQGCIAYTNASSVGGMETDPQPDGFVWSGECISGATINGTGILFQQTRYASSDGSVIRSVAAYSGTMINGFWNGDVSLALFDVDDKGSWDPNAPRPVPPDVANVSHSMGCPYYTIDPGSEWACVPGKVTNPINIPRVSPAYYAIPGRAKAVTSRPQPAPSPAAAVSSPPVVQAIAPIAPPPVTFTRKENIAFENLANTLIYALDPSQPAGVASGDAKIEAILSNLQYAYFGGMDAAFGEDIKTMKAVVESVRALLSAKGANANADQIVEMVLGVVKETLVSSKSQPAAPVIAAAPVPSQPQPLPAASAAIRVAPSISFASLRSLPFDQRWSVRDVGRGCKMVLSDSLLMWDDGGENINGQLTRLEWSGGCSGDGLANGAGALAIVSRGDYADGRTLMTGYADSGLLNGSIRIEDQDNESGSWRVWSDDAGPRSYSAPYSNGCVSGANADPNCNTSYGIAMRDNFLAGLASPSPIPAARPRRAPVYTPAPMASAGMGSKAKLTTNLGDILITSYPSEALQNGWAGRVGFTVTVTPAGTVSQCAVTSSSGYPILDDQTCNVMMRYGQFTPATDGSGRTIQSSFSSAIRWQIPE